MMSAAAYALDPERARKNLALIFQRLSSAGQARAAEAVGVSESTLSKMKTPQGDQKWSDFETLARVLAYLGLKVVPIEMRCFNPQQIGAVLALAKAHLAKIDGPDQLVWEDPE